MTEPKPEAVDFWICLGVLAAAFLVAAAHEWWPAVTAKPPLPDCPWVAFDRARGRA